jgi:hypothetical protein
MKVAVADPDRKSIVFRQPDTLEFAAMQLAGGQPPLPSNRTFGRFFAVVFLLAAVYFRWKSGGSWYLLLFALAAAFAVISATAPHWLQRLNELWFRLGVILGKVVSPIVLGVLFFVLITPLAVVLRLSGRDELRLKKRELSSYWVDRNPAGPEPETYKHQF